MDYSDPGVYANEIDQSFVTNGAPSVGAALIGRLPAGPAFKPINVSTWDEFERIFGRLNPDYDVQYAAKNYLRNANSLTVMRVLGHDDGTSASSGYSVGNVTGISDASGSNSVTGSVLAVIHHSGTVGVVTVAGVAGDSNRFVVRIGTAFAATASFLTSSADYIGKVMNTDPTKYTTYGHYLYQVFRYQQPAASASWYPVSILSASFRDFLRDYEYASTPWIKSQPLGGLEFNLFRLHTLAHGRSASERVKATVENVRQSPSPNSSPYGTFDVVVRSFDDTDQRPVVLETFIGLNLNPTDRNYILRRIGDVDESFDTASRKFVKTGQYRNRSRYVRVELSTDNFPAEALPWGFRGFSKLLYSGSAVNGVGANKVPDLKYVPDQYDPNGNYSTAVRWGVSFVSGGVIDRMRAFPDAVTWFTGSDADFSLKSLSGSYVNGVLRYSYVASYASYGPVYSSASIQNFALPFQGGFDGWDLRVADPLYLSNGATETDIGVVSLKRAVDCVSNPDEVDFNVLAVPAVHNLRVTDYCRALVNARKDAIFVMDITGSTRTEAIENLKNREVDDNYTATYYPDLWLDDDVNSRTVRVPPSVAVLATYAFSDRVAAPFIAPAGFTRGLLKDFGITDAVDRLNHEDRGQLYDNRINPIGTFPNSGIVVHGQKTLQLKASALDRINVRRLLILAKRQVREAARDLLFEPNNPTTWDRFLRRVNPILERIRQDQGINRFKVVMDTTTNTPDVIDRNGMVGKIFLEPTRAAEFITIDFVITNAGVQFGS